MVRVNWNRAHAGYAGVAARLVDYDDASGGAGFHKGERCYVFGRRPLPVPDVQVPEPGRVGLQVIGGGRWAEHRPKPTRPTREIGTGIRRSEEHNALCPIEYPSLGCSKSVRTDPEKLLDHKTTEAVAHKDQRLGIEAVRDHRSKNARGPVGQSHRVTEPSGGGGVVS